MYKQSQNITQIAVLVAFHLRYYFCHLCQNYHQKAVIYHLMLNRWRTKNKAIFHESELLREKQYEIGNFRSGQDYVIQVLKKNKIFQKIFGNFLELLFRLWLWLRRGLGGITAMYSNGEHRVTSVIMHFQLL